MSKAANNATELDYINYIPSNNSINFTATVIGNGSPIADATAGQYANSAFSSANSAALYANGAFAAANSVNVYGANTCLLYTSPSPRDRQKSRMPSSA